MKTCKALKRGKARKEYFLGEERLRCLAKRCRYDNKTIEMWEGETYEFCKTKGLVEKRGLIKIIKP